MDRDKGKVSVLQFWVYFQKRSRGILLAEEGRCPAVENQNEGDEDDDNAFVSCRFGSASFSSEPWWVRCRELPEHRKFILVLTGCKQRVVLVAISSTDYTY